MRPFSTVLPVKRPELFWSKVLIGTTADCWEWVGARTDNGYGRWDNDRRPLLAHRVAYALSIAEPPPDRDLDHLCRNRRCCNPAHLEPVTRRENLLRGETAIARNVQKTHCKHGHPLFGENVYIRKDRPGNRECRQCRNAALRCMRRVRSLRLRREQQQIAREA